MAFETRAIRETERDECVDLWCAVWPGTDSHSYFRKYFYGDVEWLPYYTQVGVVDGRLVSAVHVCKRVVACGDYRLIMGGIANVATLPAYRGRGYNSRCLEKAISVMEADAMDFSLLFTGIHDYYARQGYATLHSTSISGVIRPDFRPQTSEYRVRSATFADVAAIHRTYEAYNVRRPITVQRTSAYWRDWVGISQDRLPDDLWVCVDGNGAVCGYVLRGTFRSAKPYSADAMGMRVIELAVDTRSGPATDASAISALLEAVAQDTLAQGRRELKVDILSGEIVSALDAILCEQQRKQDRSGMVRLLHRENLFRAFSMQLNEQWLAAGRPKGVLGIETPYGPMSIEAEGSLLRIQNANASGQPLTQADFLALLFGFSTPDELNVNEDMMPLLRALFPPRAATYYGPDGF